MKPYEWLKEDVYTGGEPTPEVMAKKEAQLLEYEAEFEKDPVYYKSNSVIHSYAYMQKEEKLFSVGEKLIESIIADDKNEGPEFRIASFVYFYYGVFCYKADRPREAIDWLEKVMKVYPTYQRAKEYLIASYIAAHEFDLAGQHIEELIERDINKSKSHSISTWMEFGKFYHSIGR